MRSIVNYAYSMFQCSQHNKVKSDTDTRLYMYRFAFYVRIKLIAQRSVLRFAQRQQSAEAQAQPSAKAVTARRGKHEYGQTLVNQRFRLCTAG